MRIFFIEARKEKEVIEIYLNDIPLRRMPSEQSFEGQPVNEFIVEGINEIKVVVNPGPSSDRADPDTPTEGTPQDAGGSLRLTDYEEGEIVGEAETAFAEIQWPGSSNAAGLPEEITATANLSSPFPRWNWEQAPVLVPNARLQQDALEILRVLHAAFVARNPAPFLELSRSFFADMAHAYPVFSAERYAEEIATDLARGGSEGWNPVPLAEEGLVFRPCAGGRLLQCLDSTFEAPLRNITNAGETDWRFPVFLGRVNGQLRVLR